MLREAVLPDRKDRVVVDSAVTTTGRLDPSDGS
jgi:hypothetical protein